MNRDERDSLHEELHDVDRLVSELKAIAAGARVRLTWPNCPGKEAYGDLANSLDDLAGDFRGAAAFQRMRNKLTDDEQADADQERGEQRRAYHASVGVK